ncbi:MAG: bifunctional DNA primase/polymerase [Coriobacteriia bacterium]|nr:bifunctional DNA primase/polymerase [Coriobacteriia bacterium]MBS5479032.1 bifunctional DNA primase/polymerase [Coriobacteriia bacterium]
MDNDVSSLDGALKAAEHGFSVYAMVSWPAINGNAKKTPPSGRHGRKEATKDPSEIRATWGEHPDWGVAVATGRLSEGLVCLDLDTKEAHGRGQDGEEALSEWCRQEGLELPETVSGSSPSGGRHLFYRVSNGPIPKTRTGILPNVDFLAEGGGVIIPPTRGANGMPYTWDPGHSPREIKIAELPPEILALASSSRAHAEKASEQGGLFETVPEGSRNCHLYYGGRAHRNSGESDEAVSTWIREENQARCVPPLGADEVKSIERSVLSRAKDGSSRKDKPSAPPTVSEICEYLRQDFDGFAYNKLERCIFKTGPLPWGEECPHEWTDTDDRQMFAELQSRYGVKNRKDVEDALDIVAKERSYNPLTDMLDSLTWDGEERAASIPALLLGTGDTEYTRSSWGLFMRGAVARAYEPGCKFESVPVLYGAQGIGKSTLLRRMAMSDGYFSDCLTDLGNPEQCAERLRGKWIVEIPELSAIKGRQVEAVKSFISRQDDNFRDKYARRTTSKPRMCVLAGTTNSRPIINDLTGGRRFLPIECGVAEPAVNVNSPEATAIIEQAWAEVVHKWKEGIDRRLYLDKHEEAVAEKIREDFADENPALGSAREYLSRKEVAGSRVCVKMLMREALGLDEADCQRNRRLAGELADFLDSDAQCPGWTRMKGRQRSTGELGAYGPQTVWEFWGNENND